MRQSTRLIIAALIVGFGINGIVIASLARDFLIMGIQAIFVVYGFAVVCRYGKELDSFYAAYKEETEDK